MSIERDRLIVRSGTLTLLSKVCSLMLGSAATIIIGGNLFEYGCLNRDDLEGMRVSPLLQKRFTFIQKGWRYQTSPVKVQTLWTLRFAQTWAATPGSAAQPWGRPSRIAVVASAGCGASECPEMGTKSAT
jgi:hypothetical protein